MSKGTTIILDLRSFFSGNENNRAINVIMRVMECINIRPGQYHNGNRRDISADASELLSAVINGNPKFHKLYKMYKLVA